MEKIEVKLHLPSVQYRLKGSQFSLQCGQFTNDGRFITQQI